MRISRDERQNQSLTKWIDSGNRGTIEAATAYGKTRVAVNAVNLLRRNDRSRIAVVVVPTLQLKDQWESILREANQLDHTKVHVINSAIKLKVIRCSLLILDEIHRYGAETFSKVFDVIRYSFVLGLTATIKRLDGKHSLLMQKCPIVDTVTIQECRRNGWVSEFTEYNLGIELSEEEKEAYDSLKRQFQAMFDKFKNDFELMKNCSFSAKPIYNEETRTVSVPTVVRLAISYGFRGNPPLVAYRIMKANEDRPRGHKVSVWGNDNHPFHPETLHGFACNGMRLMRVMKEFVQKAPSKVEAALRLIEAFHCKTITFGERVETAEAIKEHLGDSCVVYHSQVKAQMVNGSKVAGAKLKRDAVLKIKTDPSTLVIATAKALDQGFDYPGAELGLILSRTSSPTQRIQRIGRIARKHTFEDGREKTGVVVNIYLKDTKDFNWLMASQKGQRGLGIYWVDSVDEILDAEVETELVGENI